MSGTYRVTYATPGTSKWTVTPCGKGCLEIASKTDTPDKYGDSVPFTGQAHLKNDEWTMKVLRPDGWVCDDGTDVAVDAVYSWNATSLEGSWDATLHEAGCGDPAGSGTGPPESFTLTKLS
jgi:hypothetical protein